jgi:hypothetical protein
MADFDQPGSFYLGRRHDLAADKTDSQPLVYDSKHLTTHAVCVGMTGSGKTGLCISLLEEAALGGIPAIAIDPKGDLGNLLLAFPNLAPSDFRPWIDESEAARRKMTPDDFAASQAELWRKGLADWDQGPDRLKQYCDAVERVIYTPGSSAGIPVTVLKSFAAPPAELLDDADAFSERVSSATSGLLALLGIDADPVRSHEHIFLSTLLDKAWRAGKDLDLRQMIHDINRPPFESVGAVDVESFFPARQRSNLAMSLNNLLASPSFASWLEGEPLEIANILRSSAGKPRLAIFSIAHLDESQRMFFVTILLNEIVAWMRTQPGTSSLRAVLYMDEVFGYFPPLANPPAKRPMLTLLKQARAYGLGCVLATQNPVDLDYKGLSNAGTWFLGRLQTERDKARVIEGLEGASAQAGATFDRQQMEATLAALGNRVFLMNNVHEDAPLVFHTRWAMSYLCGPLTRTQIKALMDPHRSVKESLGTVELEPQSSGGAGMSTTVTVELPSLAETPSGERPVVPATIREKFVKITERVPDHYRLEYRPALLGRGKIHFIRKADDVDLWRECFALQPIRNAPPDDIWDGAHVSERAPVTEQYPDDRALFARLPAELARERSYPIFARQLKEHLYRSEAVLLLKSESPPLSSKPDEPEDEFRKRAGVFLAEKVSVERAKLEQVTSRKLAELDERIRKAKARLSTQRWQFLARMGSMLWVVVDAVMSALGRGLPGRRRSLDPAFRSVATERGQQSTARIDLDSLLQERQLLQQQHDDAVKSLETRYNPAALRVETYALKPQKADTDVGDICLAWLPWRIDPHGLAEPVY